MLRDSHNCLGVGVATSWAKKVRFPAKAGVFFLVIASRPALGPNQPPIKCVHGALSPKVKWPGREADHSVLSGSFIVTVWSVISFRIEETASIYRRQLRIYCISSRGQPTRGDPSACGLGEGLTTPHRKKTACYMIIHEASELSRLL
jgi:hypothetical protein